MSVEIVFIGEKICVCYRSENNSGTPGEGGDNKQPIGDAPIAFMLELGVLYILVMRKKERAED